jgi:4-azaleucine resistance transporter AzlC
MRHNSARFGKHLARHLTLPLLRDPTARAPGRRAPHLRDAARDAGVIWLGLFALGVGFGVVVTSHGLPWWLAPVISGLMFAGSVEFILVGMLAVSAPIAAIALTTFLINSRHLFCGLSFPLHRVRGRLAKVYSVFALCDEAYALTTSKDPDTLASRRILWTQLGLHGSWAVGALVGGLVGATLLSGLEGLDFILTALFVVLTIDAYRATPDKSTLALAVGASAVAYLVAPGSMLLVAMAVFTATLVARHSWNRKRNHA